MIHDLTLSDENKIFGFRSTGVLIRDGKLLVQSDQSGEYALPGGAVKFGETSEQTVVREFKEETGADIVCERLIWVEEVFWKWGGKDAHTVAFYYLISLKDDADIPDGYFTSQKDNCDVVLRWASFDEVKSLTIYPEFVKAKAGNIADGIEHFVSRE